VKRSIRAWAASIGVVLMATGVAALLSASPAQAADAFPTTLTFAPPSGLDVSAPVVTTAGGCPSTADSYRAIVTNDGLFKGGVQVTVPSKVNFSTTDPFPVQIENSLLDIAKEKDSTLTALPPDYYLITVQCWMELPIEPEGTTFNGYMHYYTSTDYITGPNVYPGSTTEVIPSTSASPSTSTSASPSASTSTSATPDPTGTTDPTTDPTDTTDPTTDPTSDPTDTSDPAATVSTTPAANGSTLPVTGPPAGGIFILGIVLVLLGGCVVLATAKLDRPQPARW
jgi:hypothetical protein